MALATGQHVGSYEILSAIGAGGMGEVYRARDAKLARDVALKVLPEAFARDAERMARFQREAKVLASLDHPNIASIYGLEDSGATHALVMALIDGPTLADRIRSGPIPIEESLRIAKHEEQCRVRAPQLRRVPGRPALSDGQTRRAATSCADPNQRRTELDRRAEAAGAHGKMSGS